MKKKQSAYVQVRTDIGAVSESGWTIKKVHLAKRRPVDSETVKELLRDKTLRDVAKVARKYAG
jgi:hypothetical protein